MKIKLLIILVIIVFTQSHQTNMVQAQKPVYSLTIAIPDKMLERNRLVDVKVYVAGMGSYDHGSITIQSDTNNLRVDTFTILRLVANGDDIHSEPAIVTEFTEEKLTASMMMGFGDVETFPRLDRTLLGYFKLDTSGMEPGEYRLKAVFSCQVGDELYQFDDESKFTIKTRWSTLQPYIITAIFSIAVSNIGFLIQQKLKEPKKQQEKYE